MIPQYITDTIANMSQWSRFVRIEVSLNVIEKPSRYAGQKMGDGQFVGGFRAGQFDYTVQAFTW